MDVIKIRHSVREYLRKWPLIFNFVKETMTAINLVRSKTRRCVDKLTGSTYTRLVQSTAVYVNTGLSNLYSPVDLVAVFKQRSLRYMEGLHTFYLPPQQGLRDTLGEIVDCYPESSGFKILKNFAKPANVHYMHEMETKSIYYLMGNIENQALAAACLYALGLGPKLYDVAQLNVGEVNLTVLVSEYCAGRIPNMEEGLEFQSILKELNKRKLFHLVNPSGFDCPDLTPPDCGGNLFLAEGSRFCYVDSQLFLFDKAAVLNEILESAEADLHFGDSSWLINKDKKFLYQEIPGIDRFAKRETDYRWSIIKSLFDQNSIDIAGKVVFDICCNSGMFTAKCLANGAKWGIGWDLPEVAAVAEKILAVLGCGRFSAIGCHLSESVDLTTDIPSWLRKHTPGSILFFLAAWRHIGFPKSIEALDWDWLIFEGHELDDMAQTRENVKRIESEWQCREAGRVSYRDGMGWPRPLILFKRGIGL